MSIEINLDQTSSLTEIELGQELLRLRVWQPRSGSPQAIAILVHGLGAHSGWFEAFARCLQERGILALAYDQRGFGSRRSSPFKSYKDWGQDLQALSKKLKKEYGLPIYAMGNSMGALVLMSCRDQIEADGFVIFSPGFDGHPDAFDLGYKISTVLSALMHPQREVELPFRLDQATRVQYVRDWLLSDPQKRMQVPGYMLLELLKLSINMKLALKSVNKPLLMLTAGHEYIVDNQLNLKTFAAIQAPSKKHLVFQDSWHDLMFDPLVDEVAEAVCNWQKDIGSTKGKAGKEPENQSLCLEK